MPISESEGWWLPAGKGSPAAPDIHRLSDENVVGQCCRVVLQNHHSCKAQVRGYGKLESWSNSDAIAKNFSYVILHDDAECNGSSHVHVLKQ